MRGRYDLEGKRCLIEIEAIRQVVGARIRISERAEVKVGFDESQDAAEIVGDVRDVARLRIRRYHDQGHTKAELIGVVDGWSKVVVPAAPVVPGDENSGA